MGSKGRTSSTLPHSTHGATVTSKLPLHAGRGLVLVLMIVLVLVTAAISVLIVVLMVIVKAGLHGRGVSATGGSGSSCRAASRRAGLIILLIGRWGVPQDGGGGGVELKVIVVGDCCSCYRSS